MVERYVQDKSSQTPRLFFFFVFLALFAFDWYLVDTGWTVAIDENILLAVFDLRDDMLTMLATWMTFCGNTKTLAVLCCLVIILPGRAKVGFPAALAGGAGSLVHTGIKYLVARARPDEVNWLITEDGFSFPSGHANASLIFYLFLMVVVGRVLILQNNRAAAVLLRILLVLLVLLIGLSRIYLGVHYPSDVFGGWMLGMALLILFLGIYDNLWPVGWRVNFDPPTWGAIAKNADKKRGWRKPVTRNAATDLIEFPKKRKPWRKPPDKLRRQAAAKAKLPDTDNKDVIADPDFVQTIESSGLEGSASDAENAGANTADAVSGAAAENAPDEHKPLI
jgi:undecaprenyl-diphosphatase